MHVVVQCSSIVALSVLAPFCRFPGIHQYNKLCLRKVEEHWEPKEGSEDGLESLKVVREVPQMHIALCRSPCVTNASPQPQGGLAEFFECGEATQRSSAKTRSSRGNNRRGGGGGRGLADEMGMLPLRDKRPSNRGRGGRRGPRKPEKDCPPKGEQVMVEKQNAKGPT